MPRQNRSISIPEDVSEQIDAAADAAGVTPSAWLVEAARRRLAVERGVLAIDEWLADNGGPLTKDEEARAEAAFQRAEAFFVEQDRAEHELAS